MALIVDKNDTDWVQFAIKQDHTSLTNIFGGAGGQHYHLSVNEYGKLTNLGNCNIHYHEDAFRTAIGVLPLSKGGTGKTNISENSFFYCKDKINELTTANITPWAITLLSSNAPIPARELLQLGSIATQNINAVRITGGQIDGINPISVTCGGTGLNSIAANSIIYTTENNTFTTKTVNEQTLNLLSLNKNDLQVELGINEPKEINTATSTKSKLFYLLAFGV
jgi:hypothetical protein